MEAVIPSFEKSLFDSSLTDVFIELSEMGIDTLIDNPLAETIPFVRAAVGLTKTARNIHDRNLLIQTCNFAVGLQYNTIDDEKRNKYRARIEADSKLAEAELGRIIIVLNKTDDINKSVIMGRLYRSLIQDEISFDEFWDLSEAVGKMFLSDVPFLIQLSRERIDDPEPSISFRCSRLNAIGLVEIETVDPLTTAGTIKMGKFANISEFGKLLVDHGLIDMQ